MEGRLLGSTSPRTKANYVNQSAFLKIPEDSAVEYPIASDEFSEGIGGARIFGSPSPRARAKFLNQSTFLNIPEHSPVEHPIPSGGFSEGVVGTVTFDSPTKRGLSQDDWGLGRRKENGQEGDEHEALLRENDSRSKCDYGTWNEAKAECRIDTTGLQKGLGYGDFRETRVCGFPQGQSPASNKKKYMHRCSTAPAMTNIQAQGPREVLKKPEFESASSIVWQAGMWLMMYLSIGVIIYTWRSREFSGIETVSVVDAFYFCIVTMCTIGYGDITPQTPFAKLFACGFVLVGFGFIDALVSGMVTFVLDKQEHLLLSAVEGSHHHAAKNYVMNTAKGRMRTRLKVGLALSVVSLCILVGTLVMHRLERLPWIDALYCTIMSITTVGYGDHAFKSLEGRLFAAVWLLVSTLAVARSFVYLAEARVDRRHRHIAKWVLERELTVGDLVAADLNNDGSISKSEFTLFKLKEMGKVEEKDILEIFQQFNRLDSNNVGKISLSRLRAGN